MANLPVLWGLNLSLAAITSEGLCAHRGGKLTEIFHFLIVCHLVSLQQAYLQLPIQVFSECALTGSTIRSTVDSGRAASTRQYNLSLSVTGHQWDHWEGISLDGRHPQYRQPMLACGRTPAAWAMLFWPQHNGKFTCLQPSQPLILDSKLCSS
jgi:hypothetical protein